MKTITQMKIMIVTFVMILLSVTSAKATITPYTWDVNWGSYTTTPPASLDKFAWTNFVTSWDGVNGRFEMWDNRYLFLKKGTDNAYLFSGDYYTELNEETSNPLSGDMEGSINLYISMDNSNVAGDYTSVNANFTVVTFFPKSGKIMLLQKANNLELFNQTVELNRDMTGTKTIKVYNQAGVIDVYIFNQDGTSIQHPFKAITLAIPAGEVGISSNFNGAEKVLALNIKNIIDAPIRPVDDVNVTSISLNQTTATINLIESLQLSPTVLPVEATDKSINWTSSNTSVASVDATGKVTALALGTTTITATTLNGGLTSSCDVTVISVPAGDVSTFTIPTLMNVIYENDFSDSNSDASKLWSFSGGGSVGWGGLNSFDNWATLNDFLTGNYQIKVLLKSDLTAWHSSAFRFNAKDDNNYYVINFQSMGLNIWKIIDGVGSELINLSSGKNTTDFTYTINQFGNNLEVYRDLPQGERENLVAITDNSLLSGEIKFIASDAWSHSIDYMKITAIEDVATSITDLSKIDGKIYPTTTSGIVNLTYQDIKSVEVIGANGKLSKIFLEPKGIIDLNGMAKGMYLLKITTDEGLFVEKVIKQ
jgi:hypothetical protein